MPVKVEAIWREAFLEDAAYHLDRVFAGEVLLSVLNEDLSLVMLANLDRHGGLFDPTTKESVAAPIESVRRLRK